MCSIRWAAMAEPQALVTAEPWLAPCGKGTTSASASRLPQSRVSGIIRCTNQTWEFLGRRLMSTVPKPYITPEEYLHRERKAEYRSEYFRGEMFAMAGASANHNLIVLNTESPLFGSNSRKSPAESTRAT